ncbi:MAG: hypothetical protein ABI681_06315 [Gemmatimonadales bacterium]
MRALFSSIGIVLGLGLLASSPASAQIADLGRIIAKKDKDAAAAVEKAGQSSTSKPAAKPRAKPRPKPAALTTQEFSPDNEDPMSILDINSEVLQRFTAALAAESAKHDEAGKLTAARYNEAGADAGEFTPRQYFVLKARVGPLCDAFAKGAERPDDSRLAYMPSEADAIKPRCAVLMPALIKVAPSVPSVVPVSAKTTTKKR